MGLSAGVPIQQQMRDVSRGADIVVGTPGRIMDLQARGALDLGAVSTHSFSHSLTPHLTQPLTHPPPHSPTHPLTHPPAHSLIMNVVFQRSGMARLVPS